MPYPSEHRHLRNSHSLSPDMLSERVTVRSYRYEDTELGIVADIRWEHDFWAWVDDRTGSLREEQGFEETVIDAVMGIRSGNYGTVVSDKLLPEWDGDHPAWWDGDRFPWPPEGIAEPSNVGDQVAMYTWREFADEAFNDYNIDVLFWERLQSGEFTQQNLDDIGNAIVRILATDNDIVEAERDNWPYMPLGLNEGGQPSPPVDPQKYVTYDVVSDDLKTRDEVDWDGRTFTIERVEKGWADGLLLHLNSKP